jgi:hypothetical protein
MDKVNKICETIREKAWAAPLLQSIDDKKSDLHKRIEGMDNFFHNFATAALNPSALRVLRKECGSPRTTTQCLLSPLRRSLHPACHVNPSLHVFSVVASVA